MEPDRLPLSHDNDALPGLVGHDGLAESEATMLRLCAGTRLARLGVMAQEHLATGGRRMRARLALSAAEALGVARADAVPWAAATELLHNATLLHDDIQDGDRSRRDAPTAWVRHGTAQAINAGDLMLVLPARAIDELPCGADVKWRLALATARASERAARGQSADMDLGSAHRLGWEDWRWAAEGKTGALLALPVHGAAVLAGLDDATATRLAAPFATLGLVYQMLDDLEDMEGSRNADLAAGRVTAAVAAFCGMFPDEAPAVLDSLRSPERAQTAPALAARLRESGAVDAVRARIDKAAAQVVDDPLLRSVPDLRDVALTLLAYIGGGR